MKILVCVKQVPDTSGKVAVNPDGTLNRASMETIINPDDMNAVEAALKLKDETGCRVSVITMGPPPAEGMLRELMAMGADDAYLISAREFGGSDTFATSQIISAAIDHIGLEKDDIVFCGRQAIDGDTAQVGPQIAEHLGLPVISYAQEIKVDGDKVTVKRQYDDRYHMVEVKMPCLITALAEMGTPRYMTPGGIVDACQAEITTWGRADLKDVDDSNLGLAGSPTKIAKASDKVRKGAGEKVVPESVDDAVSYIVGKLSEKHVI